MIEKEDVKGKEMTGKMIEEEEVRRKVEAERKINAVRIAERRRPDGPRPPGKRRMPRNKKTSQRRRRKTKGHLHDEDLPRPHLRPAVARPLIDL